MQNEKLRQAQISYLSEIQNVQQSAEKWQDFLKFAAQLKINDSQSDYEFSTKLAIHAVNPKATDCREFGEWKSKDGNHVNRGTTGIPVLCRDNNGNQIVKHLFDTSQTALPKEPEHTDITKTVIDRRSIENTLENLIERFSNNSSFSEQQKKIFRETAEYKLCKQYGLETNENSERFSGIEKLSVKEIANIGIELNKCSKIFAAEIERSIENDRVRNNQSRNDRTELHGRERDRMDLGRNGTGTHDEVLLQRGNEPVVQTERGKLDIRTADRDTEANANSGNGQVRQHEAEIHMADSMSDRSNNAERGRGRGETLRGNERASSEPDRGIDGQKEAIRGIQGDNAVETVSSEIADTGEVQERSGGRNTSRDSVRNITDETAEPEKVSAVSVSSLEFHFGDGEGESGYQLKKFAEEYPDCSFALANAVYAYLDEKRHTEQSDSRLDVAGYDKSDFAIHAVINGNEINYEGRFDIGGDTKSQSLFDHIKNGIDYTISSDSAYISSAYKDEARRMQDNLVPFLKANLQLTAAEEKILDDFKSKNPVRVYDDSIEKENIAVGYEQLKQAVLSEESVINAAYYSDEQNLRSQIDYVISKKAVELFVLDKDNINADCYNDFNSADKSISRINTEREIFEAAVALKKEREQTAEQEPDTIGTYAIYQVKDGEEYRDYRFTSLKDLNDSGLEINSDNYNLVYTGELTVNDTIDKIYGKLNFDRPADFTGRSLSMSDIIVLDTDNGRTANYVDRFGFADVPDFFREKEQEKAAEITELEKLFLEGDIAPFMVKSVLAWDEIESLGYRMYEDGYINKFAPNDKTSYGNGLEETVLFDLVQRMNDGEDVRKEFVTALLGNQKNFITNKNNEFTAEYGNEGIKASYGNVSRDIPYSELGDAFYSLVKGEYDCKRPRKTPIVP